MRYESEIVKNLALKHVMEVGTTATLSSKLWKSRGVYVIRYHTEFQRRFGDEVSPYTARKQVVCRAEFQCKLKMIKSMYDRYKSIRIHFAN